MTFKRASDHSRRGLGRLNASEWVTSAAMIVVGAYIIYVLIQSFTETYPAFGQYGWSLMAAYVAGAVLFLKRGLGQS